MAQVPAGLLPLPVELDLFIGRTLELAQARVHLRDARLVTLTGPPGVGKTRLARHLAAQDQTAFADGVAFVSLLDITEDTLEREVAKAFGIPDNAPTRTAALIEFVVRRPDMLLVIDNCEHLVAPVRRLVETLLQAAPRLRVLATSRVQLRAKGEQLMAVPPLPPDHALELLITRGSAVRPSWGQALRDNTNDLEAAEQVCQLADGVPLAIEMCAAWMDVMTIQEAAVRLGDRLGGRFQLLVTPEGSEQSNHRSMRAALDSSFELLNPVAQRMWAVAATFAGGFDLDAAVSVAAARGIDPAEVSDALAVLVRHSVLGTEPGGGRTRFTMLETQRAYGAELVTDPTEITRMRHSHVAHFVALANTAAGDWFSPREEEWINRLKDEVPNFRVALAHCWRDPALATDGLVLSLNATLTRFQIHAGQLDENRQWLARSLAWLAQNLDQHPEVSDLRVTAAAAAAWLPLIQGAAAEYTPLLAESGRLARETATTHTSPAFVLTEACRLWLTEPHRVQARQSLILFERAEDLFAAADAHGWRYMAVLLGAMAAAFVGGDRALATRKAAQVQASAERAGARWCVAWGWWTTALVEIQFGGDLHMAMALVQRALTEARRLRDTWLPAWALWLAACLAGELGLPEQSAWLFGAAATRLRDTRVIIEGLLPWYHLQQRVQREVRHALGEDAFAAQLALGGAAAYEQALEVATTPLPAPAHETPRPVGNLTPREIQIAELVTQGLANKQIAASLRISDRTVEKHVSNLLDKLRVTSRVQLANRFADLRAQHNPSRLASPDTSIATVGEGPGSTSR